MPEQRLTTTFSRPRAPNRVYNILISVTGVSDLAEHLREEYGIPFCKTAGLLGISTTTLRTVRKNAKSVEQLMGGEHSVSRPEEIK